MSGSVTEGRSERGTVVICGLVGVLPIRIGLLTTPGSWP